MPSHTPAKRRQNKRKIVTKKISTVKKIKRKK